MDVVVRKYGGSSLATPQHILRAAKQISEIHHAGHSVVTVVSAMGKTTDELVDLAYSVSPQPNRRELDMLLTTGERISMSLLSMALHDLDCPAISFTGSQAGVLTNGDHSDAQIDSIKPFRVTESLRNRRPVVIAGYQGVDPKTKEITTLGRGGSDTTAVAMAGHFQSKRCEILKDVEGLFTADPKCVPEAKSISSIDYDTLIEMCYWGSNILHQRSVEHAKKLNVPVYIGSSTNPESGTLVTDQVGDDEKPIILSINSHKQVLRFSVQGSSKEETEANWQQQISSLSLPNPRQMDSVWDEENSRLINYCCGDIELLQTVKAYCSELPGFQFAEPELSSITVTCSHGLTEQDSMLASSLLKDAGIEIFHRILTKKSATFVIAKENRMSGSIALHKMVESRC